MTEPKLTNIRLTFDDGSCRELSGADAEAWMTAQASACGIAQMHGYHFPDLPWRPAIPLTAPCYAVPAVCPTCHNLKGAYNQRCPTCGRLGGELPQPEVETVPTTVCPVCHQRRDAQIQECPNCNRRPGDLPLRDDCLVHLGIPCNCDECRKTYKR